ncbi:pilus assembly protein TadG-related protein [Pseudomonas juntendi]|uniref:Pilus assembly protein TadG-related protein n=1 Tax=Pseudomonas juntendi TaxID=2666183 RepID=A0ABD4Y924_9PSED|nr:MULTISPECIES: pilus assembly protein TadG-related protein [Pseudomonas]MDG9875745.1 pilus assembly protein TadG-related protein [Pseudomonas juntendi]MDH0755737.1 pilus assembly protein TadG-related protein [Pseudomonas juntendi]MDH1922023.1 pilus assembly protein TadG-related protein [Pseudomonas juntendi]
MLPSFAARQRGAIGLMAVVTLGLALLFMLLVIDSGRLYLEQRKLQRIADMAALEAAGQYAVCTGSGPQATVVARAAATRNGHAPGNPLAASCGYLQTGANSLRTFTTDNNRTEAIRVDVSNTVPTSVAAGVYSLAEGTGVPLTTTLHAHAVASSPVPPQAMLSIRTTLATVDSRQSVLLNALLGALGGNVQLDVAGWQGIASTQLNVLRYLDQLAIDLNLKAGDYRQLLSADATATQLLQAAVKVLQQSGAAANVVTNLGKLALGASNSTLLQLGDLLDIQNGTIQAGLDASIQLLQLVQGVIQLAVSESAATVDLPVSVLGLVNGRVRLKVIEPQQISAVGDPRTDELRVHTAQVRAMISLDLPLLDSVFGLLNAVLDLVGPITNVLNNLLSLNLASTLQSVLCLVGVPCTVTDIILVPDKLSLDIGLEVAEATTRLDPQAPGTFSCSPKRLVTQAQSSAAKVAVGRFESSNAFFMSGTTVVKALPLVDIGTKRCTRLLILPAICDARMPFTGGGLGVRVNSKVLGSGAVERPLVFQAPDSVPPNIGLSPAYQSMQTANSTVVGSLAETLQGIQLEAYKPTVNSGLGDVLVLVGNVLGTVKGIVEPLIRNLLSPLLDPLLNVLLKALGIDLVNAEVGANLTCANRAQLAL